LVQMGVDNVDGTIALINMTYLASTGDEQAQAGLLGIADQLGKFIRDPAGSIDGYTQKQLEIADQYRAAGDEESAKQVEFQLAFEYIGALTGITSVTASIPKNVIRSFSRNGTDIDVNISSSGNTSDIDTPVDGVSNTDVAGTEANLPEGYTSLRGVGADANNSDLPLGYSRVADANGHTKITSPKGDVYDSIDDLPVPSGHFEGKYEPNPKHDFSGGNVSPQPTNPSSVLENSVPLGGNSTGRIGYDPSKGEIVVFQNHFGDAYHGYVPHWNDLTQRQKNALIKAGLFKPNGKPN